MYRMPIRLWFVEVNHSLIENPLGILSSSLCCRVYYGLVVEPLAKGSWVHNDKWRSHVRVPDATELIATDSVV